MRDRGKRQRESEGQRKKRGIERTEGKVRGREEKREKRERERDKGARFQ